MTSLVTPYLPHEWHSVGNISGCKHCFRTEHTLMGVVRDECPARLRKQLNALEGGTETYGAKFPTDRPRPFTANR